jgi:DNA replication protein DnaC
MTGIRESPTRALQEDEYFNQEDGLIYCASCHTPRQTVVSMPGRALIPDVPCRCRQERLDAEQEARRLAEHMRKVESLRASCLQDRALRDYNFAHDLGCTPELEKAHAYVEHFKEMEVKSRGLLLWGGVGTGKTFFAGCVANALIEQNIPVLMTNFARVLNTLTGMRPEERNQFIDSLNAYRLLVIDDLGMERGTEFALEQVFHVIDSRYRSKKPLIVTTNLTLQELKNPGDLAHERIYDRVLERCVPVKINGRNIRADNAGTDGGGKGHSLYLIRRNVVQESTTPKRHRHQRRNGVFYRCRFQRKQIPTTGF